MGLGSLLQALTACLCGSNEGQTQSQPTNNYVRPETVQQPVQQYQPEPHPQPIRYPVPQSQERPYHPPSPPPSSPPRHVSPPVSRPPHASRPSDPNQLNQQNEHYVALRARANVEGDEMARCFEQSHEAYDRKEGALAKELSNKGKAHKQEMERLNAEASQWIFTEGLGMRLTAFALWDFTLYEIYLTPHRVENNKDSKPGEVDLHGLYVKEAITYTDRALQDAQQRGDSELHLIVGKGLHSSQGVAKLKPAIEELVQKYRLVAELDPSNAGVLIVSLDGQQTGTGEPLPSEEITRRLENRNECIIM